MAAFSSLPSVLTGGMSPFQAIWAPLLGGVVSRTSATGGGAVPTSDVSVFPTGTGAETTTEEAARSADGGEAMPVDEPAEASDVEGSGESAQDTGGDEDAGSTAAVQRRSGRSSLIATSLRGVLAPRPDGLTRKTLLGE